MGKRRRKRKRRRRKKRPNLRKTRPNWRRLKPILLPRLKKLLKPQRLLLSMKVSNLMKRKKLRKLPEERSDKGVLLCSQLSSLNSPNKGTLNLVVCAHAKDPQLVSLKLAFN